MTSSIPISFIFTTPIQSCFSSQYPGPHLEPYQDSSTTEVTVSNMLPLPPISPAFSLTHHRYLDLTEICHLWTLHSLPSLLSLSALPSPSSPTCMVHCLYGSLSNNPNPSVFYVFPVHMKQNCAGKSYFNSLKNIAILTLSFIS